MMHGKLSTSLSMISSVHPTPLRVFAGVVDGATTPEARLNIEWLAYIGFFRLTLSRTSVTTTAKLGITSLVTMKLMKTRERKTRTQAYIRCSRDS